LAQKCEHAMSEHDIDPEDKLVCQELVELVTQYLEGGLGAGGRARFEAHLRICDECQTYLDQMRRTIWALGRLEPLSLPARARLLALFGGLSDRI
jgi:anti-sigma factor RsiW